jgi:hypothetical protein
MVAAVDAVPAVAQDAVAEEVNLTPVQVSHRRKASMVISESTYLTSGRRRQQT